MKVKLVTGVDASFSAYSGPLSGAGAPIMQKLQVLAHSSHLHSSGENCPWLEVAGSKCTNPWEKEAAASQDTLEYMGYNSYSRASCGTRLR